MPRRITFISLISQLSLSEQKACFVFTPVKTFYSKTLFILLTQILRIMTDVLSIPLGKILLDKLETRASRRWSVGHRRIVSECCSRGTGRSLPARWDRLMPNSDTPALENRFFLKKGHHSNETRHSQMVTPDGQWGHIIKRT